MSLKVFLVRPWCKVYEWWKKMLSNVLNKSVIFSKNIKLVFQQAAFKNKLQRVFIVLSLGTFGMKGWRYHHWYGVSESTFCLGCCCWQSSQSKKKDSLCSLLFLFLSLYSCTFFTRPAYYVPKISWSVVCAINNAIMCFRGAFVIN